MREYIDYNGYTIKEEDMVYYATTDKEIKKGEIQSISYYGYLKIKNNRGRIISRHCYDVILCREV